MAKVKKARTKKRRGEDVAFFAKKAAESGSSSTLLEMGLRFLQNKSKMSPL
jgi:hypothetical protein